MPLRYRLSSLLAEERFDCKFIYISGLQSYAFVLVAIEVLFKKLFFFFFFLTVLRQSEAIIGDETATVSHFLELPVPMRSTIWAKNSPTRTSHGFAWAARLRTFHGN